MKKKPPSHKQKLDHDEAEFLTSFENNEWEPVKKVETAKVSAKKAALQTLKKDVRINIRLSSSDVSHLKQIAAYEGLPYQTLISSILHKYASGHLRC